MTVSKPLVIAPDLRMPLEALTETFGIFGQKGSGKSSTSAVMVEQGVHAGGRFVIADPTGVWWGLMHDGIGPGLPGIVFGGEHADVPLEIGAGHIVAEFVVQQDEYSVVVLDLKLMRKADRTSFMLAFLETLYHLNREALHVVLDEAWQFAPTQAREAGNTVPLLGVVEDVVALGRSRGLGITMISQRFATLNANVREQIGTLGVHRLVGALDRKALKGWIEAQADPAREKEVLDVMAHLQTAQALFWSPAFLKFFGVVHVNAPQTFDSRATPKVGQRVKKPGKRAPVDLATLREKMAATIEAAEAVDPKKLQKRIRELETENQRLTAQPSEPQTIEVEKLVEVRVPIVDETKLARLTNMQESLSEALDSITALATKIAETVETPAPAQAPAPTILVKRRLDDLPVLKQELLPAKNGNAAHTGVNGPERRILDALGWYEALGVMQPSRVQVGLIAGYSHSSGNFANLLGKLKNDKSTLERPSLIDYPAPGLLALTSEGRSWVTDPGLPSTNEGVQREILTRLAAPQAKILSVLISAWPEPMTREELGTATDYSATSGNFANLLGKLRLSALIDYPAKGFVRAEDVLFPMVRR